VLEILVEVDELGLHMAVHMLAFGPGDMPLIITELLLEGRIP
jgi:hypothetical protein